MDGTDPTGTECTGSRLTDGDGNCASTGGSTTGISGDAEGLAKNQMLAAAAAKYNDVIQAGGIDLAKNHKEAVELGKHHNLAGFVKNVKTNGIWDYKDSARFANFADKGLLAEFGNWHFGFVAQGYGFNLGTALFGAGGYQVCCQAHTSVNVSNFEKSLIVAPAAMMSDVMARDAAALGFRFGDNPDDPEPIIGGYDAGTSFAK